VELVRGCRRDNEGSLFEEPLGELVREIEADKRTLIAVMETVGDKLSRTTTTVAWLLGSVGAEWS
jgi:hypothetical protein